jgi:hypothetical protein
MSFTLRPTNRYFCYCTELYQMQRIPAPIRKLLEGESYTEEAVIYVDELRETTKSLRLGIVL